jgi:uncharacterized membrane protein YphA (DoxX/SURF4 family)
MDRWADERRGLFFDVIRIYLGIGLFLKAIWFMQHQDFLQDTFAQSGLLRLVPTAVAHYVILAHLAGGLLLAIGLLTRLAALAQIPVLAGAVFAVHLPRSLSVAPRESFEFSALVLFLLVLIFLRGGGPWSVDSRIFGRGVD